MQFTATYCRPTSVFDDLNLLKIVKQIINSIRLINFLRHTQKKGK